MILHVDMTLRRQAEGVSLKKIRVARRGPQKAGTKPGR